MEEKVLSEEYKDDVLNDSMQGLRRYKVISHSNQTISLMDVTEYDVVGDEIGAAEFTKVCRAINSFREATADEIAAIFDAEADDSEEEEALIIAKEVSEEEINTWFKEKEE